MFCMLCSSLLMFSGPLISFPFFQRTFVSHSFRVILLETNSFSFSSFENDLNPDRLQKRLLIIPERHFWLEDSGLAFMFCKLLKNIVQLPSGLWFPIRILSSIFFLSFFSFLCFIFGGFYCHAKFINLCSVVPNLLIPYIVYFISGIVLFISRNLSWIFFISSMLFLNILSSKFLNYRIQF